MHDAKKEDFKGKLGDLKINTFPFYSSRSHHLTNKNEGTQELFKDLETTPNTN